MRWRCLRRSSGGLRKWLRPELRDLIIRRDLEHRCNPWFSVTLPSRHIFPSPAMLTLPAFLDLIVIEFALPSFLEKVAWPRACMSIHSEFLASFLFLQVFRCLVWRYCFRPVINLLRQQWTSRRLSYPRQSGRQPTVLRDGSHRSLLHLKCTQPCCVKLRSHAGAPKFRRQLRLPMLLYHRQ